jgi:hypothetical protein
MTQETGKKSIDFTKRELQLLSLLTVVESERIHVEYTQTSSLTRRRVLRERENEFLTILRKLML